MEDTKGSDSENYSMAHELRQENQALHQKLEKSQASFLKIISKSLDGVVIVDQQQTVVYTNHSAMQFFDKNISELLGKPLQRLTIAVSNLFQEQEITTELKIELDDGTVCISEVSVMPMEWNNEPCYVICFRDITERKRSEELLQYMSERDYLTDLPNRSLFEKNLLSTIENAKVKNEYMALLYLDLDDFKAVNDSLGHDAGDLLLKQVSNLLKKNIRAGDSIARLGSDEFVIVLGSIRKPEYLKTVANSILYKLSEVFNLDGQEVYVNASIGIAVFPYAGEDAIDLLKNSNVAVCEAKRNGKNQYRFFSEELNEKNEQDLYIVSGLRTMIQSEELFLVYQPIVDVKTGRCCGVEALLRWAHPKLGLVPPDKFLVFAERAGMMSRITNWVLNKSLVDFKELEENGLQFISINMSANDINGSAAADTLLKLVKDINIGRNKVILELTETSIMRNPESTVRKLQELSEVGVLTAVDDFGTGYSSLNYLKRLPLYLLKIDKSFVDDIGSDSNDEVIVKSTIQLAHNLGLMVIAEGVESQGQLQFLKEHGCDYVQGYYYSKPLCLDDLKLYLSLNRSKMDGEKNE